MSDLVGVSSTSPDYSRPNKVLNFPDLWSTRGSGPQSTGGGDGGGSMDSRLTALEKDVSNLGSRVSEIRNWIYGLVALILACTGYIVDKQWEVQSSVSDNSLKIEKLSNTVGMVRSDVAKILSAVNSIQSDEKPKTTHETPEMIPVIPEPAPVTPESGSVTD